MVRLMPGSTVQQSMEQAPLLIVGRNSAVHQGVDGPAQPIIDIIDAAGIIVALQRIDLLYGMAEDILIFHTGFLGDLHIGSVQSTQGHRAIEHQLHVAGAGSLCAGRRDLLRNIRSRNNILSIRTVIVLNKDNLQLIGNLRIVIDQLCNAVDIANDGLGPGITGCGLGTENIGGGLEIGQAAVLQTEVDIHDAQSIQQLPLILMEALDLHIKDEVGIQLHTFFFRNDLAQLLLLLPLNGVELEHHIIIDHGLQLCQPVQVFEKIAADAVFDHLGQLGVTKAHPAAGRDTVGLILEPLREGLIPGMEHIVLEDLTVDLGDAVNIGANIDAQVCHMGSIVPHDEQLRMLTLELGINPQNNVHDFRDNAAHQLQIPLFQRLTQNGMVGIGEGLLCYLEALIEIHALSHQKTDQLRNGHGRMGIVQLNGIKLRKMTQIAAVRRLIDPEHILQGSRAQHILLLDTQALAFPSGIIGIQNTGDILCLVLLRQCTKVILIIEGIEVQLFLSLTLPQT